MRTRALRVEYVGRGRQETFSDGADGVLSSSSAHPYLSIRFGGVRRFRRDLANLHDVVIIWASSPLPVGILAVGAGGGARVLGYSVKSR